MTVYLDIGAKRIQAYLARTPKLKARRGGSALLDYESLRDGTKDAWAAHAEINNDGKCADGVLSLQFTEPDVADAVVDQVAVETAALLNRVAPAAEWEVRISRAATYRDALRLAGEVERSGTALLAGGAYRMMPIPPAPAEVPVIRFCECCGIDPAVRERAFESGAEPVPLCGDCTRRLFEGGQRSNNRVWSDWNRRIQPGALRAERELLAGVSTLRGSQLMIATEFPDLAALGGGDANHLCTVFIDGNRFGDVFNKLKDTGVSLRELSNRLSDAVREALVTAAAQVTHDDDQALPVVPHLIGGDDLLASVTADRAWDFVLEFLKQYHDLAAALAAEYGDQGNATVPAPTASAGLVFAHHKFPFAASLDLAEEALTRAKTAHRGLRPAVCWVDVTEDGPVLPPTRTAPTLSKLAEGRARIDKVLRISPSGQAELARAAQDGPDAIADLAHRMGNFDAIRPFLQPDPPLPLHDVLVLGRWWT